MKRLLLAAMLIGYPTLVPRLGAQDAASAAAAAERQEAEERYRRLTATIEAFQANQDTLQRKIGKLQDEIRQMRDDMAKPVTKYATPDDLNRLADKIKELDEQRKKDRELILSKIELIAKTVKDTPVGPPPPSGKSTQSSKSAPTPTRSSDPEKGYEYAVQKGDTLGTIISAYNEEFKKQGKKAISLKQVLDANPGLKPERMKLNQKIFIPMPE